MRTRLNLVKNWNVKFNYYFVFFLKKGYSLRRGRILRLLHTPTLLKAKLDLSEGLISKEEFLKATRLSNFKICCDLIAKNLVANHNSVNIFMSFVCLAPSDVFGLNNIKYKLQVKDLELNWKDRWYLWQD